MGEAVARRAGGAPAGTAATDEALLAAVARGEPAALAALHARYAGAVAAVALRIVGDRAAAEEVTQEAFLRVWLRARAFDPARGRAAGWLLALARHEAIDHARRRRRQPATLPSTELTDLLLARVADPQADLERAVVLAERRRAIAAALGALPAPQRAVIEQLYFGDLTHAEAADRLGVPLGTVKSRLALALRRLRAALSRRRAEPMVSGPAALPAPRGGQATPRRPAA
jgi:RNA polymerase sigma-70 factor (ECF subfamily)